MAKKGSGGMGSHKHGISGHTTKSPRFRFLQKLEAESHENDRKQKKRIMYGSVQEAFKKEKRR